MLINETRLELRIAETERSLRERFGELIGLNELALLLHFPSVSAVRKARLRGRLPVAVAQLPNRRGWYTTPKAVAQVLANMEELTQSPDRRTPVWPDT
jgi:hypothetical protein